jgi:Rhodanese-related sulfurtransferase
VRLLALLVLALAAAPFAVRGAAAAQPVATGEPTRAPTMIEITVEELLERTREPGRGLTLIDVRSAQEFAAGHLPGAINIPLDQIGTRAGELPADGDIVFYCQSGTRSRLAIEVLRAMGVDRPLLHFGGGMSAWQAAGQPTEPARE